MIEPRRMTRSIDARITGNASRHAANVSTSQVARTERRALFSATTHFRID